MCNVATHAISDPDRGDDYCVFKANIEVLLSMLMLLNVDICCSFLLLSPDSESPFDETLLNHTVRD